MKLIGEWRRRIKAQQAKDTAAEEKGRIRTSGEKNWVSPADIEALEEQMVPWLREKRRRARR